MDPSSDDSLRHVQNSLPRYQSYRSRRGGVGVAQKAVLPCRLDGPATTTVPITLDAFSGDPHPQPTHPCSAPLVPQSATTVDTPTMIGSIHPNGLATAVTKMEVGTASRPRAANTMVVKTEAVGRNNRTGVQQNAAVYMRKTG